MLLREGRNADALAKFDEALRYAPRLSGAVSGEGCGSPAQELTGGFQVKQQVREQLVALGKV